MDHQFPEANTKKKLGVTEKNRSRVGSDTSAGLGPTQHLQRSLRQAHDALGEGDGDGDVVAAVAEQRAFWEREVKPQGLDVRGGVNQPGNQVFLQTGCDLSGQEEEDPFIL